MGSRRVVYGIKRLAEERVARMLDQESPDPLGLEAAGGPCERRQVFDDPASFRLGETRQPLEERHREGNLEPRALEPLRGVREGDS